MTTTTDIQTERFVDLDERESNGIRVTLLFDRVTSTVSVCVWDERTEQCFTIELDDGDDAYDVFHHPFAYAAFREDRDCAPALEFATCA